MHKLQLFTDKSQPKILCLGAHADDIEIGCGGTILKLIDDFPKAEFRWIVFSANGNRAEEAYQSVNNFLKDVSSKYIDVQDFKDSYFPFVGSSIKDYFVNLKKEFSPDLVFTHSSNDAHQDHQLISKLTWNAYRDNLIMEYEIPKYDADLGVPNVYVQLKESIVRQKIKFICETFKSQLQKQWFGEDTLRSIMRIRGVESNSKSKFAEAFYCRKIVI